MSLSKTEIDLFFKLHPALLQYVNQRKKIFPDIKSGEDLRQAGVDFVGKPWTELWNDPTFIDDFVSENPEKFSENEIEIVRSWKHFISGNFYIFRHLKKYTIFLTEEYPARAYGVQHLNTPLDEMFLYPPVYTKAVLLPLCGQIIYDGILQPHSITFGRGFQFDLNESYKEAKSRFGIIEKIDFN